MRMVLTKIGPVVNDKLKANEVPISRSAKSDNWTILRLNQAQILAQNNNEGTLKVWELSECAGFNSYVLFPGGTEFKITT